MPPCAHSNSQNSAKPPCMQSHKEGLGDSRKGTWLGLVGMSVMFMCGRTHLIQVEGARQEPMKV